MMNLKFTSLFLICGGLGLVACGGGDDSSGGDDLFGSGGAPTGSGGDNGSGGDGSTPGGTGGGDNTPNPLACEGQVIEATGTPTLIDDFSGLPADGIPANDGRGGQWAFGNYKNPAGVTPEAWEDGTLHFTNDIAQFELAAWNANAPWEQWASADMRFLSWGEEGKDCYNAAKLTGIKFKAKSSSTPPSKIRVQFNAPGANSDTGETYNSADIQLTADMAEYEVPFASCKIPSWSLLPNKDLPTNALISLSFVTRSGEPQSGTNDAGDEVEGETLLPWDITFDDVEFY